MYIGRFVIIGRTQRGSMFLGYRVSSRSFPNRMIRIGVDRAAVLPTEDAAKSDNPYISYNCFRMCQDVGVVGNGSQVDPIIDKVALGYPVRDAITHGLLALDYERDAFNTPRIAAALRPSADMAYLGFVGIDTVYSRRIALAPGQAWLAATYECTDPTEISLAGETAQELCDSIYTCTYELPVTVLVAKWHEGGYQLAARSAR
jgi:IMP cyclohydrolase